MYQDPVPSVTFAAAYAVFPPASKPSLSGVIVAVVSEIVRTNNTEAEANHNLRTPADFGFLIGFIFRVLRARRVVTVPKVSLTRLYYSESVTLATNFLRN